MSNPRFNNQTHPSFAEGKAPAASSGKGGAAAFKEKPAFATGAPGKKQSADRSGGVTRAKTHPNSDGI